MHGIRTCIHENALRAQTHICNTIHDLPAHQHNHERTNNNNFVVALGKKPVQELHVCLLCISVSVCAFECACVLACSVCACVRTGGYPCAGATFVHVSPAHGYLVHVRVCMNCANVYSTNFVRHLRKRNAHFELSIGE